VRHIRKQHCHPQPAGALGSTGTRPPKNIGGHACRFIRLHPGAAL